MQAASAVADIEIIPTDAPVGAEVRGVDLTRELTPQTVEAILDASARYGVIFFRGLDITPEQQIRFAQYFGPIEKLKFNQFSLAEHPEILLISNFQKDGKNIGVHDAGKFWHSDSSYVPKPSKVSLLYAHEVPVEDGQVLGDTQFIPTFGLYETLPEETRRRLEGLKSVHRMDARLMTKPGAPPEATHPVVVTHPRSGAKCIFVNEGLTREFIGMGQAEGEALLLDLCDRLTRPERIYRHKWRVGDLLIWDNLATQHHATHDYAWPQHRRLMHRITVEGAPPQ